MPIAYWLYKIRSDKKDNGGIKHYQSAFVAVVKLFTEKDAGILDAETPSGSFRRFASSKAEKPEGSIEDTEFANRPKKLALATIDKPTPFSGKAEWRKLLSPTG